MSKMPVFRVLGPLEAWIGVEAASLGGRKQRCVLAMLLLNANSVVSRDRLIEGVWGDNARTGAASTLQVYVANLRKVLDPERTGGRGGGLIQSVAPGYVLWSDAEHLDLIEFDQAVAVAAQAEEAGDHQRVVAVLQRALMLWRGALVADLADEEFIRPTQTRLDAQRGSATAQMIETRLDAGGHLGVLNDLHVLVDERPYDERLRGLLMIALYRAGRQADALKSFRAGREMLVEELGIDPTPELAALENRILQQDPSLLVALPTGGGAETDTVRAPRSSAPTSTANLVVDGVSLPLIDVVTTLGRQADRDVVLQDDQASRRHAEIRRSGDVFVLFDLGSTNGTSVNGTPVHSHQLVNGDIISVGAISLRFLLSAVDQV